MKLNIIPLSWCSAMWQCAIQRPGFVTSSRMSTVSPGADEHGVLPDEVGLRNAVAGEDDEAAGAVDVERMVHRVVRVHLVDEPELDAVADRELPIDPVIGGTGVAVDELPAHVGRRRQPVDLDHVVLPLDPARVSWSWWPWSCRASPAAPRSPWAMWRGARAPRAGARDARAPAAFLRRAVARAPVTSAASTSFMPHFGQRSGVVARRPPGASGRRSCSARRPRGASCRTSGSGRTPRR